MDYSFCEYIRDYVDIDDLFVHEPKLPKGRVEMKNSLYYWKHFQESLAINRLRGNSSIRAYNSGRYWIMGEQIYLHTHTYMCVCIYLHMYAYLYVLSWCIVLDFCYLLNHYLANILLVFCLPTIMMKTHKMSSINTHNYHLWRLTNRPPPAL